ncbi:hypothetical protein PTSG_04245 [Salpingoeca rosetta]|uniref:DNA mismatch repair proteins mutS family domain-containing protein n=1 Tax=Salpingoeca rosetta (strain ATCC 50818 / BSB-021) TaxID=946362 RepID=F2U705_SALR5|nr:uncharacterized protein PTSG_04245 [Salpingoeca rosetta]EGD83637.1 hypothetical protein PTSG_04245 [Salpingoeca rosetta]|eukprot:XP_004995141.1 hypothetical protein PTSG_04245 [Salpingoeca rosetta]
MTTPRPVSTAAAWAMPSASATTATPASLSSRNQSRSRSARQSSRARRGMSTSTSARSGTAPPARTPRSVRHTTPAAAAVPTTICAVVEGRGKARGEIGLASVDLNGAVAELSQFSDGATYLKTFTKVHYFSPIEVVMPSTMCAEKGSKLFTALREHHPDLDIVNIPRKFFAEEKGTQVSRRVCAYDFRSVRFEVQDKFYALAAFGALIKYVSHVQNMVFAPNSLKIIYSGNTCATMMDATTVKHLELLQSIRNPSNTAHSLFGVLDHTKTVSGGRFLRAELLQPPSDVMTIQTRQEAVEFLLNNQADFEQLGDLLSRFEDMESLITHCIQIPHAQDATTAERRIGSLLRLKHNMELVPQLCQHLSKSSSSLLGTFAATLQDGSFAAINDAIVRVFHEEARVDQGALNRRTQHIYAIREGIHGMLDVARRTYGEAVADITELCQQLSERYEVDLALEYTAQRGFFFITQSKAQLPAAFKQVSKSRQRTGLVTQELQQMNTRIRESMLEIFTLANTICADLFAEIRAHLGSLYRLTEIIAMTDFLQSLATFASFVPTRYVRPEFSDTLAVKGGCHPILMSLNRRQELVPNDTFASKETSFIVITGPNMSGKSVYLRQVALLQVLAQLGSFVPAEFACFRVCDQIFTRIGNEDSFETNSSTFMVECQELNFILRNATEQSLIIIDELGRGTSPEEGLGLCFAACEYMIQLQAFTFFATHFSELCRLDIYPSVEK